MSAEHPLVAKLYQALNDRKLDAALAILDPGVDWDDGRGGSVQGPEAVGVLLQSQWAENDPTLAPQAYETDDAGWTVVEVREITRAQDGSQRRERVIRHVFLIEGGLISSMAIRRA
jgi:SnoaL-like protein